MLFVIQPSATHGVEVILNALDAILLRVEDEVHELEIIQADDLASSDWYMSLSSRPTRQRSPSHRSTGLRAHEGRICSGSR
jgi:hypothetical protein